eukprot:m.41324 g.41324  ORF g.41324 m.41324 type:complete len:526 (-) comp8199_c0_seq1:264-1841(-)
MIATIGPSKHTAFPTAVPGSTAARGAFLNHSDAWWAYSACAPLPPSGLGKSPPPTHTKFWGSDHQILGLSGGAGHALDDKGAEVVHHDQGDRSQRELADRGHLPRPPPRHLPRPVVWVRHPSVIHAHSIVQPVPVGVVDRGLAGVAGVVLARRLLRLEPFNPLVHNHLPEVVRVLALGLCTRVLAVDLDGVVLALEPVGGVDPCVGVVAPVPRHVRHHALRVHLKVNRVNPRKLDVLFQGPLLPEAVDSQASHRGGRLVRVLPFEHCGQSVAAGRGLVGGHFPIGVIMLVPAVPSPNHRAAEGIKVVPGGPEPGPPAKLLATEDGLELGVGRDLSLGVASREREPCGPERLQDGVLHVGGSRGHRVDNQPGLPGEVGVAVVRHGPVPPTVLVQVRHLGWVGGDDGVLVLGLKPLAENLVVPVLHRVGVGVDLHAEVVVLLDRPDLLRPGVHRALGLRRLHPHHPHLVEESALPRLGRGAHELAHAPLAIHILVLVLLNDPNPDPGRVLGFGEEIDQRLWAELLSI